MSKLKRHSKTHFQFDQTAPILGRSPEVYALEFSHPLIQAYYNLMVNTAILLGAEEAVAKKDMRDVLEFDRLMAMIKVIPSLDYSEDYQKMQLSQLEELVPGFNFSRYTGALLPRKLNAEEEVVIVSLPYFQDLTELLERTDKRCALLCSTPTLGQETSHTHGHKLAIIYFLTSVSEWSPTTSSGASYDRGSAIWTTVSPGSSRN